MNSKRSIFDEHEWLGGLVFIPALVVPGLVLGWGVRRGPAWAVLLLASLTCIPTALGVLYPLVWLDRWRREDDSRVDRTGVSVSGILYAQAAVFFYAPTVAGSGDEGPPLLRLRWYDAVVCWIAAAGCAWLGYMAKTRRQKQLALAQLAEENATLAARFVVRTDRKGWSEIEPGNVLHYQSWFERCLKALGTPEPQAGDQLTETQERALVACAREARFAERFELWPHAILCLVLAYLRSTQAVRERDRHEWAGALATRVNASDLRDWVDPYASHLFEKYQRQASLAKTTKVRV